MRLGNGAGSSDREGRALWWLGAGAWTVFLGRALYPKGRALWLALSHGGSLILQSVTCAQLLPSFFCYDSWYVRESSGLCLFVLP